MSAKVKQEIKSSKPITVKGLTNLSGGVVKLNLPTSNPNQAGALWVDSGVVKVSAGS